MKIAQYLATMLVAVSLVACASTSKQAGTGEYIDDTVITAKVKAKLIDDPTVKAREINVETFKGEVQLSGFVADPADAAKAVELARSVQGVTSVKNDVRVK
jgi:osmotically-inducible protein OsmY